VYRSGRFPAAQGFSHGPLDNRHKKIFGRPSQAVVSQDTARGWAAVTGTELSPRMTIWRPWGAMNFGTLEAWTALGVGGTEFR